jgi:hypothetical protein
VARGRHTQTTGAAASMHLDRKLVGEVGARFLIFSTNSFARRLSALLVSLCIYGCHFPGAPITD